MDGMQVPQHTEEAPEDAHRLVHHIHISQGPSEELSPPAFYRPPVAPLRHRRRVAYHLLWNVGRPRRGTPQLSITVSLCYLYRRTLALTKARISASKGNLIHQIPCHSSSFAGLGHLKEYPSGGGVVLSRQRAQYYFPIDFGFV